MAVTKPSNALEQHNSDLISTRLSSVLLFDLRTSRSAKLIVIWEQVWSTFCLPNRSCASTHCRTNAMVRCIPTSFGSYSAVATEQVDVLLLVRMTTTYPVVSLRFVGVTAYSRFMEYIALRIRKMMSVKHTSVVILPSIAIPSGLQPSLAVMCTPSTMQLAYANLSAARLCMSQTTPRATST